MTGRNARQLPRLVLLAWFGISAGCASSTIPPSSQGELSWLEGCWTSEDGNTVEHWTIATDQHLFGSSVTVADGEVAFFEFMQIEPTGSGYVFSAYPRGIGPNPFPAESIGQQNITFANAEHDYPQRITYERRGDALAATISAIDGSNPNAWSYRACPQ